MFYIHNCYKRVKISLYKIMIRLCLSSSVDYKASFSVISGAEDLCRAASSSSVPVPMYFWGTIFSNTSCKGVDYKTDW